MDNMQVINDSILDDVKTVIGLSDDDNQQNKLLKIYIRNAINEIKIYLGINNLDEALQDIVQQMATAKFTKRSFEGTKQASEEGLSLSFSSNDLEPFMAILDKWQDNRFKNNHRGRVVTFD